MISNRECEQAVLSIDKALELASLYNLSLGDLMENETINEDWLKINYLEHK